MKKLPLIALAVLVPMLCAWPAAAIIECENCYCELSCSTSCVTGSGWSTCGAASGICSSAPQCQVGCLTAAGLKSFVASLGEEPAQVTPADHRRAQVAARLTWRLAQHAEEGGLGSVYAGPSGFRLAGLRGRVLAADIALVGAGAAPGRAPGLVVELAGRPGARAEVARWLAAGSGAVLVVDPEARTVRLHRGGEAVLLRGDDVLELPDLLPGWSLRVGDLFD